MLPLLAVMVLLLLSAGMLVFLLGLSTGIESNAQTAADAAALAGEQELVNELRTIHWGPNGRQLPPTYDPTTVCQAAQRYATMNHGVMSCPGDIQFLPVSGLFGTDVEVTVHSQGSLPNGSIDPGKTAVAQARASTDPFSQSSPPITTTLSCDASVVTGDPYNPPTDQGNAPGFFAKPGTNYTQECEPKLAGKLEALAKAKGLHLVGVLGYDTASPSSSTSPSTRPGLASEIQQAHACGAASTTQGLPGSGAHNAITEATLRSFGLSRPIPGAPDEIELARAATCQQRVASAPNSSQPVIPGNSDVHLVDLNGGPVGSFSLGLPGSTVEANYSQKQLGCIIYSVDQMLHADSKVVLASFLGAWAESTMRNITSYTPGQGQSLGLFQQQASDGWGTPAMETNPAEATAMFLQGAGTNQGAIQVDAANPGLPPWLVTQNVQHSAFSNGSNYEAQMGTAQNMIAEIQGGMCDQFNKK